MSGGHEFTTFRQHQASPGGFHVEHGHVNTPFGMYGTQQKAAEDEELGFYERNKQLIQCGLAGFVGGLALGALLMYRQNGGKK